MYHIASQIISSNPDSASYFFTFGIAENMCLQFSFLFKVFNYLITLMLHMSYHQTVTAHKSPCLVAIEYLRFSTFDMFALMNTPSKFPSLMASLVIYFPLVYLGPFSI